MIKSYLDLAGLKHFKNLAIVNELEVQQPAGGSKIFFGYIPCSDEEIAVADVTYFNKVGSQFIALDPQPAPGTSVKGYYKQADKDQSAYSMSATEEVIVGMVNEELGKKVSSVNYDTTNKKLTYTNGGLHDIMTFASSIDASDPGISDVPTSEAVVNLVKEMSVSTTIYNEVNDIATETGPWSWNIPDYQTNVAEVELYVNGFRTSQNDFYSISSAGHLETLVDVDAGSKVQLVYYTKSGAAEFDSVRTYVSIPTTSINPFTWEIPASTDSIVAFQAYMNGFRLYEGTYAEGGSYTLSNGIVSVHGPDNTGVEAGTKLQFVVYVKLASSNE